MATTRLRLSLRWVLLGLFGALGLVLVSSGVLGAGNNLGLLLKEGHAQGVVIWHEETRQNPARNSLRTFFYPVIEYSLPTGEKLDLQLSNGRALPFPLQTGSRVDVVYDRGNPRIARIDDFFQMGAKPLGLVLGGLASLSLGWLGYRFLRKIS